MHSYLQNPKQCFTSFGCGTNSLQLACKAHGPDVVENHIQVLEGVVWARVPKLHPQGKGALHGFHQVVAAQTICAGKRGWKLCMPHGVATG